MDRADKPPLSHLSGQLKLGIVGGRKREAIWEDLALFGRDLLFYLYRRAWGFVSYWFRLLFSGFTITEQFKTWLSRRFIRRKGQLAFPFAHVTLAGVSLSLLVVTTGLGSFIFENTEPILNDLGAAILSDNQEFITEESLITRDEAIVYTVAEGETIFEIAQRFLVTVDALASANDLRVPYSVSAGQELTIPPIEGFSYEVREGDTVESLARRFAADPQSIVELNYLFSPYALKTGTELIIPASTGEVQLSSSALATSSGSCGALELAWPTKVKGLVGAYTYTHRAIDLPATFEELFASAAGTVRAVSAGSGPCFSFSRDCNYGYGGHVFIDLGDGYELRYAHISTPSVSVGQEVEVGEVVAISGDSGVAYGPHLHFELLCNGQKISPLPYLE